MDDMLNIPRAGTMFLVCRIPELAGGRVYKTNDLLLIDDKRVESDAETYAGVVVGPGTTRLSGKQPRIERYSNATRQRASIPRHRPISTPAEATIAETELADLA